MGGKGKKRREKNYRAAHGGTTRLPPPLNTSSIDAIPSKLRQIMAFSGEGKGLSDKADRKKGDSGGSANGRLLPNGFNLDVCGRLAEMKKKHKESNTDEHMDFPGHEEIKFGEVVEAPPKLAVPKAFKNNAHDLQKRLRLQAVEAYRQRKGWTSRLGLQISPQITEAPLV
ncbi:hypothetical protein R3W88_015036 [Solanum pinnatisectum]|uniref:Uncharacterized protein n=1 Tax=Solanum pinnatisectum TaxID=50273 RepID=A0AAV9KUP6_9SOLN|nr:hypothetical protein R3W88_015036 [Solanum pinnatisectum]